MRATAVRTCRLARELLDGHRLVKLEVLGDEKTLFPDVIATLKAAEVLVKDGFTIAAARDPVLMASAMRKAIEAGREAYLAGRMAPKRFASAPSPLTGLFF
jgi:thiazole synthase ThiGH ThiG subunit